MCPDESGRSHPTAGFRIKFGDRASIGPGKIRLMELINEHGSISAAGRAMRMSYRRAWMMIESLNAAFTSPLVVEQTGGSGGGGAILAQQSCFVRPADRRGRMIPDAGLRVTDGHDRSRLRPPTGRDRSSTNFLRFLLDEMVETFASFLPRRVVERHDRHCTNPESDRCKSRGTGAEVANSCGILHDCMLKTFRYISFLPMRANGSHKISQNGLHMTQKYSDAI
jgi:molybdate transport repressor ModE-like protein